jgi:hypothetical protein
MLRPSLIACLGLLMTACGSAAPLPPGRCAIEAQQLKDSPEMNTQGGGTPQIVNRENAKVYVQQALDAAARGDGVACTERLRQARSYLAY